MNLGISGTSILFKDSQLGFASNMRSSRITYYFQASSLHKASHVVFMM